MEIFRTTTLGELGKYKNPKNNKGLFDFWRFCEKATAFFVIISLVSSTIDYEINYSPYRDYRNCYEEYKESATLRWLTFASSVCAIIFVVLGAYSEILWEEYLYSIDPRCRPEVQKRKYRRLAFEIILLMIFPYSNINAQINVPYGIRESYIFICFDLFEILYAIMWIRLYFLVKIYLSYSPYVSHVARRVITENKLKPGLAFTFKCMFKTNPMTMIIFFIGIPCILTLGMMSRVFERPLIFLSNQDWVNPITAVWVSYSTMMIGVYGDYFPLSLFGRLTNVACYLVGTVFFVLILANMEKQAFLSKKQRRAFNDISLMKKAADLIKYSMKYYYLANRNSPMKTSIFVKFRQKLVTFKNKRWDLFDKARQSDLDSVKLKKKLRKMRKNIDKIHEKVEIVSKLLETKRNLKL